MVCRRPSPRFMWMTSQSPPHPDARSAPSWRRLGWVILCGMVAPSVARAQSQLDLSWDAPAGCPQADAVRSRIRELAGDALRSASHLSAAGRVVKVGERYRLTLSVRETNGPRERTMESDSCADLAGAAAVALGLLLKSEPGTSGASGGSAGST